MTSNSLRQAMSADLQALCGQLPVLCGTTLAGQTITCAYTQRDASRSYETYGLNGADVVGIIASASALSTISVNSVLYVDSIRYRVLDLSKSDGITLNLTLVKATDAN